MRKIFVALGLVTCAVAVFGCSLLKKDGAAADAAVVPDAVAVADVAAAPVAVSAKNAASVARFPAETSVADDDLKLASVATARTAPKTGDAVATLQPGTDVTKLAEYQSNILVTFADPKDASATLMGWIGRESFSAAPVVVKKTDGGIVDAGAASDAGQVLDAGSPSTDAGGPRSIVDAGANKLVCPLGMVAVVLSKDPVCRRRCRRDAECKGGAVGSCANASTAAGMVAKVCVSE